MLGTYVLTLVGVFANIWLRALRTLGEFCLIFADGIYYYDNSIFSKVANCARDNKILTGTTVKVPEAYLPNLALEKIGGKILAGKISTVSFGGHPFLEICIYIYTIYGLYSHLKKRALPGRAVNVEGI